MDNRTGCVFGLSKSTQLWWGYASMHSLLRYHKLSRGSFVAGGFAEQIPKGPKYADFSGLWIITVNVVTKHALFTN